MNQIILNRTSSDLIRKCKNISFYFPIGSDEVLLKIILLYYKNYIYYIINALKRIEINLLS